MKHETALAISGGIVTGAAGVWVQGAVATLAPYVGGYIIGVSFGWIGGGAPNVTPVVVEIGIGPNGGAGVQVVINKNLPITYIPIPPPAAVPTPASVLVTQWSGNTDVLDLRAPIPGGILITANNTWLFARSTNAAAVTFAPTVLPQFLVSLP